MSIYDDMSPRELVREAAFRLASKARELRTTARPMGRQAVALAKGTPDEVWVREAWLARLLLERARLEDEDRLWRGQVARAWNFGDPLASAKVGVVRKPDYSSPVELLEVSGLDPARAPRVVLLAATLVWASQSRDIYATIPLHLPTPELDPPPPAWVEPAPQWTMWRPEGPVQANRDEPQMWTPRHAVASWMGVMCEAADVPSRVWLAQWIDREPVHAGFGRFGDLRRPDPEHWTGWSEQSVSDAWRMWWGWCTWPAKGQRDEVPMGIPAAVLENF